jgi:hypothetical protein
MYKLKCHIMIPQMQYYELDGELVELQTTILDRQFH